mmetsp:Transcript_18835/g.47652  ORF Transcript_18835/g.47652 Transcript_18835/m.47652 type:complete len:273 (+) Transcript_18835:90-908(+)
MRRLRPFWTRWWTPLRWAVCHCSIILSGRGGELRHLTQHHRPVPGVPIHLVNLNLWCELSGQRLELSSRVHVAVSLEHEGVLVLVEGGVFGEERLALLLGGSHKLFLWRQRFAFVARAAEVPRYKNVGLREPMPGAPLAVGILERLRGRGMRGVRAGCRTRVRRGLAGSGLGLLHCPGIEERIAAHADDPHALAKRGHPAGRGRDVMEDGDADGRVEEVVAVREGHDVGHEHLEAALGRDRGQRPADIAADDQTALVAGGHVLAIPAAHVRE